MRSAVIVLCLLLVWLCPRTGRASHYFFAQVRQRIEQQVTAETNRQGFVCRGEPICGLQIIPLYYQSRMFEPVWFDQNGLRPTVTALIQTIRRTDLEGLNPTDYHLAALERMLTDLAGRPFPPDEAQAVHWADFDLILTDAFLMLASHISSGRINPETLHADWLISQRSIDMLALLNTAATSEQMLATIARLQPAHRGYVALKSALQHMRQLGHLGGWPQIDGTGTLKPGDTDARIPSIRQRMLITGDLTSGPPASETNELYDAGLADAVRNFQKRHGLAPDGVIGRKTRRAMNVTAAQHARQIVLNLERWRWLPRDLGERYIVVNTADFKLQVIEKGQIALDMRVVVGRPARRTPVFSSTMSYLVLNPFWTVPRTIAVEDILPKLDKEGIDYLAEHHIKVYGDSSENAPELEPLDIPWQDYSDAYFPVRLRQEPGKNNALGQIKFIFPNKFAVYLHDTPQRSLFGRVQRDFSSGCIRVENAFALAAYLLSDDPGWTPEKLKRALELGDRQVVRIPRPIAVHLLYMTAWVDENNALQFRDDIYGRDRNLNAALLQRNPAPPPVEEIP